MLLGKHVRSRRSFLQDRAGGSAIEFALIGPMFVLLMVCMIDMGFGFYRKMQTQSAAQAGAQYAIAHGFKAETVTAAAMQATSYSGISVSPAPSQFCGCATSTGLTSTACGSVCTGGATAGTYVMVSAQATYSTLLPYPTLPSTFLFTAQSTVRIQ